jgi:hypothetical protein
MHRRSIAAHRSAGVARMQAEGRILEPPAQPAHNPEHR